MWEDLKNSVNALGEVGRLELAMLSEDDANHLRDHFVYTADFLHSVVKEFSEKGYDDVPGHIILELLAAQVIALYKAADAWPEDAGY